MPIVRSHSLPRIVRSVIIANLPAVGQVGLDLVLRAPGHLRRNDLHRVRCVVSGACEVPMVAAINGPAIGLRLDIACICDVRVCADRARFASSFIKLGVEGPTQRLLDVLELSAAFQALAHETRDHAEAVEAFLQKREPKVTGA